MIAGASVETVQNKIEKGKTKADKQNGIKNMNNRNKKRENKKTDKSDKVSFLKWTNWDGSESENLIEEWGSFDLNTREQRQSNPKQHQI